jgi:hypothetical protein
MENITRIADLPDNSTGISNSFNPNLQQPPVTNGYVPINVHPNPYGISAQNPIMAPPQQQQVPVQMQQLSEEQKQQLYSIQQQRLPSRDIHQDSASHIQDDQVKPNYIPPPKQTNDYVRDHEDMTEKNLREYEEKNRKEKKIDILLTEFQTPIFVTILFFLFQLPMVNTLVFKKFSFLSIYNSDGNFNINGLIFKSIAFGAFYYCTLKFTTFLSEI